ncbi:hypothetical protein L195_g004351 [Trifolium pratense]|uniref:DCD domain-containing protein n=1 Tax=Trifolium pratense TaxID=57577 RepID=A0A2K3NF09_TRIPR|nr:hypothetical protein L195_g019178 [Trifolium pratense]PNY01623.1 hypothetical protein L195_g024924 [Trifolium pratense]PNY07845.1 hypothetical protein L195_g004351 [Trifolium pratense]
MDSKDFRKKRVSGCFPEHGAIFMSNRNTLQECFGRSLFGLPDSFSSFVKNVKAGMILFLFQFEDRKLHGVFKAISDGGMNIVPRAYASSGKQFPAQVKFTSILRCDPLFENEFSDVIRDNYYTPKKFHFGLSKDQVQNLMWLFKSRKREVPRSLHQKKRKNRKWDFQVIEDKLMKGRVTNTWKRKLNNPGTSVTAEQESAKLILSPESCGKCESIHFNDDAYDPENPGFNYSVGSGAHSAASSESHELPTMQEKKGDSDILEEESENFIPLCSTDNSDLEDGEIDNCSEENQIDLDMLLGNYVSSIPIPRFLLSNNEECNKVDDSSSVAVSDLQSKDESEHLNSLLSKGLYSDEPKTQTSVFSRLSFSSKGIASKNRNDANGKHLSRAKHQYQYEQREKITQKSDGTKHKKRDSVFMRLTGASDDFAPRIHFMAGLKEGTSG